MAGERQDVTPDVTEDLDKLTREIEESLDAEEGGDGQEQAPDAEQPEQEEGQEGEEQEEGAEQEVDENGEPISKPAARLYTDEEVEQILNHDGKLDQRRLTPTQKLIQRSFARYANKGYQEIAAMKRELQAQQAQMEQARMNAMPPRNLEEAFDRDPNGVLQFIDNQLVNVAGMAEKDPFEATKQLANLQAIRNKLTDRALRTTESRRDMKDTATATVQDVIDAIPDCGPEKQEALTTFAVNELGYTREDLKRLTNPANGKIAAQTVKTIHAAWFAKYGEKMQMKKSVQGKKVVKMPVVEGAGRKQGTTTGDVTMKKAMKSAKESGDWTEVLNLKGVLPRLTK